MPVDPDRFLHIFDSLDYHLAIYDREWRYTYVNEEAARLLGRPAEELLGRSIWELFPDAVGNQYYRELHEAVATGRAIHSDHYYAPFTRWFENHIYPLPDGVMVLARDVTDQRRAAEAFRARDEMLRLAQRAGGVATFEWDFRNQVAQCSAEFFRIFGLPEQDGVMTAAEWAQFVHPEDRDRMGLHLARTLSGKEPAAADYRVVRPDGSTRWLSYTGELQLTSEGERMLGTVLDITERKRVEEALRASEERLQLALDAARMVAWDWDLATDRTSLSPSARTVLGYADEHLVQTSSSGFACVPPEDRAAHGERIRQALSAGGSWTSPFRFVRPDNGRTIWLEDRGRVKVDENGQPVSASGVVIDITERKGAELALQAAKEAAESANQLKDQFLATLSHELRTPLNAILGYARMLQTGSIPPERRQRAVDVIERNAVAQNQLVEDLLDMSRITTGKVRLDPAPVPVTDILLEALDGVKPAADAKRITLDLDLDPSAGLVRADAARLQQVFWNILTNAVKFTPAGGRLAVSVGREGHHVKASVTDSGIGIAGEFLPFVFDPFRQADARFGREHGGLGLGLAISKQLVELHGGTIHAASDGTGQGATFTVRLPSFGAADPAADADITPAVPVGAMGPAPDAPLAAQPLAGLDILLVDDEADTVALFRDALEEAGADVRTADSAAEAIRLAAERAPDVLVTDLGLPGMDGYELLRRLRTDTDHQPFAAVAVTAYARLDDRARALSAGFQAHVAKPIDPSALVRALVSVSSVF